MSLTISISDDEVSLLDQLLHAELTVGHSELRRTRNPAYRDQVRRRQELAAHLLEVIQRSGSARQESAAPAGT